MLSIFDSLRDVNMVSVTVRMILAVLCGAAMYFLREKYQTYVLWLLCGEMLVLCVTIFMMELLIKNLYDENGQRIDGK